MESEEPSSKRPDDPLRQLHRQDLDPLSVAELDERIAALEAEIARTREKLQKAEAFRAGADQLFRKS